jgi:hypothetical protein
MKRIYKTFTLALAAAMTLSSCSSDLLDEDPSNAITTDNIISTSDNVSAVLMGAYDQTGHYLYLTLGQIGMDVMGDDAMISSGAYGFSTYNWHVYSYQYIQYANENNGWWSHYCEYMWRRAYTAINQCNNIIQNADNLPSGCEDYLAQAHGLRGWNFLNLYYLFCPAYNNPTLGGDNGKGLFLRLVPGSADASTDVERSDLKTSFEQIISDLTYAYEHCTSTSNQYINRRAAALLLARTYLELDDYANASKFAEAAAANTFDGSNLMSQDEWRAGFMSANSEWLWGFHFDNMSTNIYASIPSYWHMANAMDSKAVYGTKEYGTKVPGASLADQLDYLNANAVDYQTGYSDVRMASSFVNGLFKRNADSVWTDCRALFPFYIDEKDGYVPAKFNNNGSLGVADFPMARIAEAYLIESEAKYRQGDEATALKVLNALQKQRGGSVSTSINIDEIWKERRRELYGEGRALGDLKRLQKPLERTGADQWSSTKSLPANSPRMMYPIPDWELDYNPHYKTSTADYNRGQNDAWAR